MVDSVRVRLPGESLYYRQHAHSAKRRYISYSEADFEVVCPTGAKNLAQRSRPSEGPPIHAKFHPHRCNGKGIGPENLKILPKFYQTPEYKRPAGHIPCTIFTKSLPHSLLPSIPFSLPPSLLPPSLPPYVLPYLPLPPYLYTSLHTVDSIRGFAHAASFAAARQCL